MTNQLEIILTGTGTPIPVPGRAGPGVFVRTPDGGIQIDTGRSTVLRLSEAGVRADELDAVCLTHHHSDHITDLGDVLVSAWLMDSERSVDVIAPAGLAADFARDALQPLIGDMEFRREHRGVRGIARPRIVDFSPESRPMRVWQRGETVVEAVAVRHEPVQAAVGYRVSRQGLSVVVSGDTRACDEIERLAEGAQVLVHEVVSPERVPAERKHTIDYHAIPAEVGALAERAGVGILMLTHLWPAPETPADAQAFLEGVRSGGFSGEVIVGCDLASVRVSAESAEIHLPEHRVGGGLHSPHAEEMPAAR